MAITEQAPGVRPQAGFWAARWALRIIASLEGLLVALQPISIGQYLNGRYALFQMHSAVAGVAEMIALLLIGAVIWYVAAGGRTWVLTGILLGVAIETQAMMGYIRDLAVHVPLGVAVVGGTISFAIWSWTPASGRFRPRRRPPRSAVEVPEQATDQSSVQSSPEGSSPEGSSPEPAGEVVR